MTWRTVYAAAAAWCALSSTIRGQLWLMEDEHLWGAGSNLLALFMMVMAAYYWKVDK